MARDIRECEKMEKLRAVERLVRIEESEPLTRIGWMRGTLELDGIKAWAELQMCDGTLVYIHAECGLVIEGPYLTVLELLGIPNRSRLSDMVRALTVRVMELTIGAECMDAAIQHLDETEAFLEGVA